MTHPPGPERQEEKGAGEQSKATQKLTNTPPMTSHWLRSGKKSSSSIITQSHVTCSFVNAVSILFLALFLTHGAEHVFSRFYLHCIISKGKAAETQADEIIQASADTSHNLLLYSPTFKFNMR